MSVLIFNAISADSSGSPKVERVEPLKVAHGAPTLATFLRTTQTHRVGHSLTHPEAITSPAVSVVTVYRGI